MSVLTLHSDAYGRKRREVRRLDGIDVATTYFSTLPTTSPASPIRWGMPGGTHTTRSAGGRGRMIRPRRVELRLRFQGPPRPPGGRQGAGDERRLRRARPGYRTAHRIGGRRRIAGRQPLRRGAAGLSQRGVPTGATRSVGGATVAEIAYDQDEAGRLARQGWTVEGITHTQSATYDAGGRVVERVYPDGTSSGTHGYNAAGWLDRLGLAITATRYDARGQAVGVEHGRGRAPSPPTMRRAAGSLAGRRRWAQRSCSRLPIRAGRRGGSRRSPARVLRRAGPTATARSTDWSGPTTRWRCARRGLCLRPCRQHGVEQPGGGLCVPGAGAGLG